MWIRFEHNNLAAGEKSWYDVAMTKSRYIDVKRNDQTAYRISWYESGKPEYARIHGRWDVVIVLVFDGMRKAASVR